MFPNHSIRPSLSGDIFETMYKKYLIAAGLFVLVMVVWLAMGSNGKKSNAILVSPKRGTFNVDITTTGELKAKNSVKITGPQGAYQFQVYNLKIQKLVPEGTEVKKGDFVAQLDRSEITGKLQDAKLELQKVQSQFEQAQLDSTLTLTKARNDLVNLKYDAEEKKITVEQSKFESPAVQRQTRINYDRAIRKYRQAKENYKTQVKQSDAKLSEINAELEKRRNDLHRLQKVMKNFTIRAPDNGMVIYRRTWNGTKIKQGSSISSWDPEVAELPDFSVMESVTYVNEVDIQKVKLHQSADIGLDAMPDKHLKGTITHVANIGEQRPNSDSKVFEVVIQINKSDTTLRPAMTTSNVIHIKSLPNKLYVPLEAIHARDSLNFVFRKSGLETVMQQVKLGTMNETDIVIKKGLSTKDEVYLSMPEDTTDIKKIYLTKPVAAL